jgi:hypothetical protein
MVLDFSIGHLIFILDFRFENVIDIRYLFFDTFSNNLKNVQFDQGLVLWTLFQTFKTIWKILLTLKVGIQLKVLGFILLHSPTLVEMCLNPNTTFTFSKPNSFVMPNFGQEPKVRVTTLNICFYALEILWAFASIIKG